MSNLEQSEIGGYRIVDFLGAGGMGRVYRAVHVRSGHVIAIKVLSVEKSDDTAVSRFKNEARIQSSLQHPNIVSLYDCLELNGNMFLLMEYVDGQTLSEHIRKNSGLSHSDILKVFSAVVQAVIYIHSRGIIHRDIKSENIKISSDGIVKLMDFGISKSENSANLTMANNVVGTINYLSPEQLQGGKADFRSDIWSLGILLYEMLSGRLPFDAPTIGGLCEQIKRGKYPSLSTIAPTAPPLIVEIATRCLQQKPDHRFASVEDIDKELKIGTAIPGLQSSGYNYLRSNVLRVLLGSIIISMILLIGLEIWHNQEKVLSIPSWFNGASSLNTDQKEIVIDVKEGTADVYWNDNYKGKTPLVIAANDGEDFTLVLKQDGFEDYLFSGMVTEQTERACTSLWMKKIR